MKIITTESIRNHILSLADEKYKQFHSGLVPGEENIIGVRVPMLRQYAKELYSSWKGAGSELIALIGDEYYEEIMLQGMIIGLQKARSAGDLFPQIEGFLPKINNWAICDTFCAGLKEVRKFPQETYEFLQKYLKSDKVFERRFGLVMLLDYYIDEEHLDDIFRICEEISGGEQEKERSPDYNGYYVKMAVAWLISMCFVKFYDETLVFMKQCALDDWTYNKAIQKTRESLRIKKEQKDELQAMKRNTTEKKWK